MITEEEETITEEEEMTTEGMTIEEMSTDTDHRTSDIAIPLVIIVAKIDSPPLILLLMVKIRLEKAPQHLPQLTQNLPSKSRHLHPRTPPLLQTHQSHH